MHLFRGLSIKIKLGLLVALAAGTALALACTAFVVNDQSMIRQSTKQHFTAVADVLGANTVAAITFNQPEPAREVLSSLRFEPQVEFACVYDRGGNSFATYQRTALPERTAPPLKSDAFGTEFADDGQLHIVSEIRDVDGPVGVLLLQVSMDHLQAQLGRQLWTTAAVLVVSLAVSLLASSILQKRIAGPILVLAETAAKISLNRDYSVRVDKQTDDELGSLFDAFNRMLDQIQEGEHQLRLAHEHLESRVVERTRQLTIANQELAHQIVVREQAELSLRELQEQHMEAARRAGMADVATGVLHNVGNVLNSVNVSVNVTRDKLRNSRVDRLGKAVAMMSQHREDLGTFLTSDERGRRLPDFLDQLSQALVAERDATLDELGSLETCVEHIKEVVSMQQSFATNVNCAVAIPATELMEDSIKLNDSNLVRHGIRLVRRYEDVGQIVTDRHKVLQILINLVSNAKHALKGSGCTDREIVLTVARSDDGHVQLSVADNGVGIPAENLTRIFNHGFTTKQDGHGFGLHSAALAAGELGGSLRVHSDGPGCGARFTLELPIQSHESMTCAI